jgi:hypothetical protein
MKALLIFAILTAPAFAAGTVVGNGVVNHVYQ